ncbi:MAG: ATP-binding cassette domain-containing protein [Thermoplasmata archaeon]
MLEVSDLSYDAGSLELREVSFGVARGETLVVLGPTGAGKTVLLELIAGFRTPRSGSILMDGREITDLPPEKRKIGMLYQDYLLFPHLDVFENIAYGLRSRGMRMDELRKKVDDISSRLAIGHLLNRKVRRLSGGEQQRVSLARALVTDPSILLLDEPFSAVDPETKENLMRQLSSALASWDIPVIYVTHDQIEAAEIADTLAVLSNGRIVQIGAPGEVFSSPKSEFVARFLGSMNIYKGRARKSDGSTIVRISDVSIFSSTDIEGDVHVTIRPEDIIISRKAVESSARNSFWGKVVKISEKGPIIFVTSDFGIEMTASITRQSFIDLDIGIGDDVCFTFKATNVNLF